MHKGCKCGSGFLALLILVFSFWTVSFSKWIIVVSAALILLKVIAHLAKHGCHCKDGSCGSSKEGKAGEEVSITGDPTAKMPGKEEVKKAMVKKATKKKAVKAVK